MALFRSMLQALLLLLNEGAALIRIIQGHRLLLSDRVRGALERLSALGAVAFATAFPWHLQHLLAYFCV